MDFENYKAEMIDDITEWIESNIIFEDFEDMEALREYLYDELWDKDSITGNGPVGHYYDDTIEAKSKLFESDNYRDFYNVREEFAIDKDAVFKNFLNEDWDWFDTSIRCFLLGECIDEALNNIEEDFNEAHNNNVNIADEEEDYDEGFNDIEESMRRNRRRRY